MFRENTRQSPKPRENVYSKRVAISWRVAWGIRIKLVSLVRKGKLGLVDQVQQLLVAPLVVDLRSLC